MITEAFVIGLKEGFKIGIVWFVFYSFLYEKDRRDLIRPFFIGLSLVFLFSAVSFFIPPDPGLKDWLSKFIGFTFAIFFISSVGALYQSSGLKLFSPFSSLSRNKKITWITVLLSAVFFFLPDSIGSSMFVRDISLMKEAITSTYISALAGFSFAIAIFWLASKKIMFNQIGRFFGIAQLLLFLSVVKLLGGGIKGFAELSLIPSAQRGITKFLHDAVHQILVLLMVPDHTLLSTTTFRFIGIFFGTNIAMIATLLILLSPPLMFLYHSIIEPAAEPLELRTGAEKRRFRFNIRSEKRKKALPVILFIGVILLTWFSQRGESVSQLYNPKPVPVVEDRGFIVIPLTGPVADLMDGALHKFSLVSGNDVIRILIIKKPDNTLSVCLDACEICPPEGYGQREKNVICIYCNTPIPVETLGEPGGCNPVPLIASVSERDVRIELSEILKKWQLVKTGKSKEAIR